VFTLSGNEYFRLEGNFLEGGMVIASPSNQDRLLYTTIAVLLGGAEIISP
jgi:hypothetical protein